MIRVEHRCLDGTPFPVVYADAGAVEHVWYLDLEHAATAMTPLADAVRRVGQPGEARAYADCGVTTPALLAEPRPVANGYEYHRAADLSVAERTRMSTELRTFLDAHGGTFEAWRDGCLPGIRQACGRLTAAPASTPFAQLAEDREHAWGLTTVAGLVARTDERAVAALCAPAYGERATAIAYELAQGSTNETTSADAAVVHLAALEPGSAAADAARAAFLESFGDRAVGWPIDEPTLSERPDLLDAQVRVLRSHRAAAHGGATHAAARRERLVAEVERALADETERARFRRRLARLAAFVPVREARARWQLIATGAMRRAVQARGRDLVGSGVLDHPEDVFLLTPAEYDDPPPGLRGEVPDRRAEHRHWSAVSPPPTIGGPVGTGIEPLEPTAGGLAGVAGAPGVATGPARVIVDLDDVERLEPGDILVSTMTSPAWTPLFTIAAAVVTDAGDALSHVAIAAREYGIPCVAGTGSATAQIPDGALVVVDGDAGTVHPR